MSMKSANEYIISKVTFTYDIGQGPANGEFDGPLYVYVTPVYELCLVGNMNRKILHHRFSPLSYGNIPSEDVIKNEIERQNPSWRNLVGRRIKIEGSPETMKCYEWTDENVEFSFV